MIGLIRLLISDRSFIKTHSRHLLLVAYDQLVGSIRTFVHVWYPSKLKLCAQSLGESQGSCPDPSCRGATAEVYFPSLKTWLIALSFTFFSQFISTELNAIQDCYIADCDMNKQEIKLLGAGTFSNILHSERVSVELDVCDKITRSCTEHLLYYINKRPQFFQSFCLKIYCG